jgi:hypothetical protein
MIDACDILDINRDVLKDFHLLANRVADHQTERVINQNVRKLKSIEERMFVDEGIKVSKQSIDEILYNVIQEAHSEDKSREWTMRELRIVSYYLMKLQDEEEVFDYALKLLDKDWKNMYFNGLVFYLMNSWCLIKPELRFKTSRLVIKKLQEYRDNNKRYLLLKNHANMFEDAGPQRLASLLINQNKDVREAPIVLGSKLTALSQSYFSDVIVYYSTRHGLNEDKLEEIFETHDLKRTKQLVFADLVQKAERNGDPVLQTQLSKFINRTLGDVTLTSTWAPFLGATYEEAQKLKKAMQQVNLWFTRRVIETFFEVCVQDKERKKFWLEYVPYVRGFKIVGSTMTKRLLQNDSRVSNMFQRHFIETNSTYSQTAALVLSIKDYILVEFSDTGSLYAYKQNHNKVQFLRKGTRYMTSTNELKDTSVDKLVENDNWYGTSYNDEGRLMHIGYWQDRLKMWLQIKVMSSSNTGMSFFDTKDDDTFTAQPLPKQEKIKKPVEQAIKPKVEPVSRPQVQSSTKQFHQRPGQDNLFSGVPEYSLQQKGHISPKAQTDTPPRPTEQPLTNAVYESNVYYNLSSKWLFNDICRIVCGKKGFYINIHKTRMYVKIKGLDGESPSGSIWIKRPNLQGWSKIIHSASSGKEIPVGYIKQGGGGLIYKLNLEQTSFMTIKTR